MEKEICLKVFFDGACNGRNTGGRVEIGIGVCTLADGVIQEAYSKSAKVGRGTNNDAEFKALIEALKQAAYYQEEIAAERRLRVQIFGDSQVIINLFNGDSRSDIPRFKSYLKQAHYIRDLIGDALEFVKWIPREMNVPADEYSKKCFEQ